MRSRIKQLPFFILILCIYVFLISSGYKYLLKLVCAPKPTLPPITAPYQPAIPLTEDPIIPLLTPKQLVEYIKLYKLECNLTTEELLAGRTDYILASTVETEEFLDRMNYPAAETTGYRSKPQPSSV